MHPVGSFVAAQGCSSCSEACGILAPQQGSNSSPLHCKADSSPLARWEVPFFNASFYSSSSLRSHSAVTAAVCVPSDLVTVVPQACAAPSSLTLHPARGLFLQSPLETTGTACHHDVFIRFETVSDESPADSLLGLLARGLGRRRFGAVRVAQG